MIAKKIKSRSSTLMGEYIKIVLGGNGLTKEEEKRHFLENGFDIHECAYCGSKDANTLDHIYSTINDSKFTGYDNSIKNLIPCCQPCNSSKGKKTIEEWLDNEDLKERAIFVKNNKGYPERREKINLYIKKYNSNIPTFSHKELKLLNERAEKFKIIELEKLKELDDIIGEDREYYLSLIKNK